MRKHTQKQKKELKKIRSSMEGREKEVLTNFNINITEIHNDYKYLHNSL